MQQLGPSTLTQYAEMQGSAQQAGYVQSAPVRDKTELEMLADRLRSLDISLDAVENRLVAIGNRAFGVLPTTGADKANGISTVPSGVMEDMSRVTLGLDNRIGRIFDQLNRLEKLV